MDSEIPEKFHFSAEFLHQLYSAHFKIADLKIILLIIREIRGSIRVIRGKSLCRCEKIFYRNWNSILVDSSHHIASIMALKVELGRIDSAAISGSGR